MSNKYDYFARDWHLQRVLNNTPEMNGNDSQPIKLSSSTFN